MTVPTTCFPPPPLVYQVFQREFDRTNVGRGGTTVQHQLPSLTSTIPAKISGRRLMSSILAVVMFLFRKQRQFLCLKYLSSPVPFFCQLSTTPCVCLFVISGEIYFPAICWPHQLSATVSIFLNRLGCLHQLDVRLGCLCTSSSLIIIPIIILFLWRISIGDPPSTH